MTLSLPPLKSQEKKIAAKKLQLFATVTVYEMEKRRREKKKWGNELLSESVVNSVIRIFFFLYILILTVI